MFMNIQMPELLYKSLAAKLVVGMPVKVYSYSVHLMKRLFYLSFVALTFQLRSTTMLIQDLATVDSILLRELPPVDDDDGVRALSFGFITLGKTHACTTYQFFLLFFLNHVIAFLLRH